MNFETAFRKQESAATLVAAAESAFAASLEAYNHGLGTYIDVANAQRNVTARNLWSTRSAIYISTAALALSVGDLARPAAASNTYHQK